MWHLTIFDIFNIMFLYCLYMRCDLFCEFCWKIVLTEIHLTIKVIMKASLVEIMELNLSRKH